MIYTFYSYKGGVGRSMAMANVAEYFYMQGLRVLLIDWDLEAPGLESFYYDEKSEGIATVRSKLGVIDLLTQYKRHFSIAAADPFSNLADKETLLTGSGQQPARSYQQRLDDLLQLDHFVHEIHGPLSEHERSALLLMPAGWRQDERFEAYAATVQSFDWDDFYASYRGYDFFDWFAGKLNAAADVVLIDSRTGVTEMGGVCARHLADVVVSFCAPNVQNLTGVDRIVRRLDRDDVRRVRGDNRPLDAVVVPARIEGNETEKLLRFIGRFKDVLDLDSRRPKLFTDNKTTFWDLQVPYVSAAAFEERRVFGPDVDALGQDPQKKLQNAYSKLATHLALLAPDAHPVRQKMAVHLRAAFPELLPPVVLLYAKSDGRDTASFVCGRLEQARIAMWPDLVDRPGEMLDYDGPIRQARFLAVVASPDALASSAVRGAVRLARQLGKVVCCLRPDRSREPLPEWLSAVALPFDADEHGVQSVISTVRNPPPVLMAPNLAPVTERLVKRPYEMMALQQLLAEAAKTPSLTPVVLAGLGGSGKTTLAAAVCHDPEVEALFPGGIVWLDAKSRDDLAGHLAAALTGDRATPPAVLRQRLGVASLLVVVDDAADARAVAEMSRLIERGVVLLIVRDQNIGHALGARTCSIGAMSSSQAAELVDVGQQLSEAAEKDRAAVIEAVDGWPLGLALMRRSVEQRLDVGVTVDAAWRYVREQFERHGVTGFDRAGTQSATARSVLYATLRGIAARPDDEKTLIAIAQRLGTVPSFKLTDAYFAVFGPSPVDRAKAASLEATIRGLAATGVLSYDGIQARVHPVVYGYLLAEGRIARHDESAKKRTFSSSRDKKTNADVAAAREILAGRTRDLDEMEALIRSLKAARYFDCARRLIGRMRSSTAFASLDPKKKLWYAQQFALCTYKDGNLVPEQRFRRALEILHEADDLQNSTNQETLGLAGAIYKYRWMFDGNRDHLERSAMYYARGAEKGIDDDGYTAINAAFLFDLIAFQEERAATRRDRPDGAVASVPASVLERRTRAHEIRESLVRKLGERAASPDAQPSWWVSVTLAEAHLGLGTTPPGTIEESHYDQARYWLREALAQPRADWEYETTARQFASIATMQERQRALAGTAAGGNPEWDCLRVFVGNRVAALRSLSIGKVGLALSGGGFRASLFHIGVLARMAEADLLRHVEVLSCVSGGSIIGAHFYLELRRLLESKEDDEITRDDYIELVNRVERDFLAGVQRNLRTRVAASPVASLRMVTAAHYSRTRRLGELYESQIFSRVQDGRNEEPRYMHELFISPKGTDRDTFAPKLDNWMRAAKVPELILNATTINTGHNWQFTAAWMGEPPAGISEAIDGNNRLRRMYYWEAPEAYRKVRLGHAVAASSCVPGLFEPLSMPGLHRKHVVELVDGGVHDNQGLAALIEQECKTVVVSDASGQMANEPEPSVGILDVFQRSNDMLMARVRESQFRELAARREAAALNEFIFIHLKKDLDTAPVDWIGCMDPHDASDDARPASRRGPLTGYGILKSQQEQLAAIRTDLDSFTDMEAFALMYSGYRMMGEQLEDRNRPAVLPAAEGSAATRWRFLAIEPLLAQQEEDRSQRFSDNLRLARHSAWKILRPTANRVALLVVVLLLVASALGLMASRAQQRDQLQRNAQVRAALQAEPRGGQPALDEAAAVAAPRAFTAYVGSAAIALGRDIWTVVLWILRAVATALIIAACVTLVYRLFGVRKSLSQSAVGALLVIALPLVWLHLLWFDRWYLRWGTMTRTKSEGGESASAADAH